jgi:hypothetical protein
MVHVGTSVAAKARPHDHGTTQAVKNESKVGLLWASASHPDCRMDPDDSDGTSRDPWARHWALDSCGRRDARPDTCPGSSVSRHQSVSESEADRVLLVSLRVFGLDMWYQKDETRRMWPRTAKVQDRHAADKLPQGPNFATLEVR